MSQLSLRVRPARVDDEARVVELLAQLIERSAPEQWAATFHDLLDGRRGAVLVAEDAVGVLGVISFSYNLAMRYGGEYCQVEELVADEAARGRQAGAALVQAAIAAASERGCAEIGLYPRPGNEPFYEKYGFRTVGVEMRQPL